MNDFLEKYDLVLSYNPERDEAIRNYVDKLEQENKQLKSSICVLEEINENMRTRMKEANKL